MPLERTGHMSTGDETLDGDLRDLVMVTGAAGTFLYAATGQNGGISAWRLDPAGGLARLSDSIYFAVSGMGVGQIAPLSLDGRAMLVLNGIGAGKLVRHEIGADGTLSGGGQIDLPADGGPAAYADLAAVGLAGGITAVYMADAATGALRACLSDGHGRFAADAGLAGPAAAYRLAGEVSLAVAGAGGAAVLLAADAGAQGLRSFRIDPATGALTAADSLGAADGLGIAGPSALEVVSAHGATWAILAGAGSGSLSVIRILPDGSLRAADHVLDTLATRFAGVTALKAVTAGEHVFVLAGGADDGLSLFALLPGGQLVHLQSLAHAAGLGLDNVTAIEAAVIGDALQVFVSSGTSGGLTQFALPLGDLGAVIEAVAHAGGAGGAPLTGTAAADLLLDHDAGGVLLGRAGDDILVSGADGSVLTGGAGADIFVLRPTDGGLRITDFEPGTDRLDLSAFPMLRDVSQLSLRAAADGIWIGHGRTGIRVQSADGGPLSAADLWPGGFATPDRVPLPGAPARIRIAGTRGDDVLEGTAGADRVLGRAGDDILAGGPGRDRLRGGSGRDDLSGGRGADTITGQAGDDRLRGGAGADVFVFGAGHGADRIADFAPGADLIRIGLAGTGFADLEIHAARDGAAIDTGAGTITLSGVAAATLTEADFLFG